MPPSTAPPDPARIEASVKDVLLRTVLAGEDPKALTPATPLLSSGILDSIRTVTLIGHLEDAFDVSFEAHEMNVDHLDTIEAIARTIHAKLPR